MIYVLVCTVTDNGKPYYYTGEMIHGEPVNTQEYKYAIKSTELQAMQSLMLVTNRASISFKYTIQQINNNGTTNGQV